jgi:F0F1-type ATP synthase membrane subunit c/vacuolar-type H+-ATPase subunit K
MNYSSKHSRTFNLLLHILVKEGGSTLSAVVTIVVLGHEASNSGDGRVLSKPDNLSSVLNLVVLEGLKRNGLVDTLVLLGLGVNLLLPLLSSSTKTEDQVQGGLLLDVVIGESTSIFQLLTSEDQTLLIRGDSLLVLDLGFDIVNGIRWLNIERDGLACCLI